MYVVTNLTTNILPLALSGLFRNKKRTRMVAAIRKIHDGSSNKKRSSKRSVKSNVLLHDSTDGPKCWPSSTEQAMALKLAG